MNSGVKKTVKPAYYNDFECLGPGCRYTCCQEWSIAVGRKEYSRLKSLPLCKEKDREDKRIFRRIRKGATDRKYVNVSLNERGLCPFLDEEKLCSLQLAYGHQVLPTTCKLFPRIGGLVNGVLSYHLSLGCEAVLKLLFRQPSGISFIEEDVTGRFFSEEIELGWNLDAERVKERPVLQYDKEITLLAIYILQMRRISLDDRMLFLGLVMEKLSKLEEEGQADQVPSYIKSIMEEVESGDLDSLFVQVKGDRKIQALNAVKMMELFFQGMNRKAFQDRVKKNLGIEIEMRIEENGLMADVTVEPLALERAEKNMEDFLSNWKYIMENIAVTWFSQMHMPFYFTDKSIWENYVLFASLYHMLKFLVMGYLGEERKAEDFIQAVTVCSRTLTHSVAMVRDLLEHLLESGTATLAHIAILVK